MVLTFIQSAVLFVFMSLIFGGLVQGFAVPKKLPSIPFLLFIGLIWGLIGPYSALLGDPIDVWAKIDSQTINIVFIPVLVFVASSGTDYHTFKKQFWKIAYLTGPGVVIQTLGTAYILKEILDYPEITWEVAFTAGALLSSIDHTALVNILKDQGAPKRLSALIDGEALVLDATVMVIFEFFLTLSRGDDIDYGDAFVLFCRLFFGGALMGLFLGLLMSLWMKNILNDSMTEISVTFVTVYMSFLISEHEEVKISGTLAIVALGIYMSARGKTYISQLSEQNVNTFWLYLNWCAESVIFVLSGVIMADRAQHSDAVTMNDWGKLVGFFALLFGLRAIFIIFSYPILNLSGYKVDWKACALLIHGACRGSVCLALAIVVNGEESIDQGVRDLVMFHTAGLTFISQVLTGSTALLVIRKLRIIQTSSVQQRMLQQVIKQLIESTEDKLEEMKQSEHMRQANWDDVRRFSGLTNLVKNHLGRQLFVRGLDNLRGFRRTVTASAIRDANEVATESRIRFLSTLKGLYWQEFQNGQCTNRTVLRLIDSANINIDAPEELNDWILLEKGLKSAGINC